MDSAVPASIPDRRNRSERAAPEGAVDPRGLSPDPREVFENLRLELRRGTVVLAVLAALRAEQCGYTLRKTMTDYGLAIDEGTLYPLLRRLESQGLLSSQWREQDKRNKRSYRLSREGKQIVQQLPAEWNSLDASLRAVVKEQNHGAG